MGRMNIRYYIAQKEREFNEPVDIMTGEQKEAFLKLCNTILRFGNERVADILEAFKKMPYQSNDRCVTDVINLHNSLIDFVSIDDDESFGEIHPFGSNKGF